MGNVESGVRVDLARIGCADPTTALEFLAITLAQIIDSGTDKANASALARELRLTLAAIRSDTPANAADRLDEINGERRDRQSASPA